VSHDPEGCEGRSEEYNQYRFPEKTPGEKELSAIKKNSLSISNHAIYFKADI
jgi:hypothetical protein